MKGLFLENKDNPIHDFAAPIWKGIEAGSDGLTRKPEDDSYLYDEEPKSPDNFDFSADSFPRNDDGFCFTVSLHDAITLHVTSRITMILGYPKDMLKGQCILNYLYPRDRLTFASHLSQGLQSRFAAKETKSEEKIVFYVRIREYKTLSGGFGVVERKGNYRPFQLTCIVKDIILGKQDNPKPANEEISTICLVASASPILPAHKVPNEKNPAMTPFSSRHTSSCHYSHIDTCSIPYLGYLPQDIVGYSVFDFYHQDDLHLIRDIYELVIREEGSSFRSKPYRFRVFNGDYITLETDWSSFINPWSRRMEFVIGHHRIVNGPTNPNVFSESEQKFPLENPAEKHHLQEEVRNMLSKPIKHFYGKMKANKRKRNLAAFVSNIIDGIEVAPASGQECSCSDPESVVMGAISPHQDDSDLSSETPASFQQMRLQDNIERFFASQPKTNCAPSSSSGHSATTSQNNSPYGSGSNDDSVNLQQTCNSMDSGINGTSSNSFDTTNNGANSKTTPEDKGNNRVSVTTSKSGQPASKQKKPEHGKSFQGSGGPVNANCVSLTEEVLSHHNKITSKRMIKSTGSGCTKNQKKMEASKFKRTAYNSSESIVHTKPKQPCFHTESRRKFNVNNPTGHHKTIPTSFSGVNLSSHEAVTSTWPLGIPVLVNQAFTPTEVHGSFSYTKQLGNRPQILMAPIMYLTTSPMTIYSGSTGESSGVGGSGGSSALGGSASVLGPSRFGTNGGVGGCCGGGKFCHHIIAKRNVKLQTDLDNRFNASGQPSPCKLNMKETSKSYKQFDSVETSQSAQTSIGTFSLSEETSDPSDCSRSNKINHKNQFCSKKTSVNGKESIDSSCDSNFKYTIPLSGLEFTLRKDYALLENMEQPLIVKKQLNALGQELTSINVDDNSPDFANSEDESKKILFSNNLDDSAQYQQLIGYNILEDDVNEVSSSLIKAF
ncbi:period circadian protein-like isoform X2 [Panonychus citri]|uniref:period circadian protein-like isoform X2 n=1 Tax=Panonychus citri TaxID=50023 RepID=UPI00230784A9|nr:period circadian protein-like isoform X2 [Panonychus citri]